MSQPILVLENDKAVGEHAAQLVFSALRRASDEGRAFVLGCPSGRTPRSTYKALAQLIDAHGQSISHVTIAMMDEYLLQHADGTFSNVDVAQHFSCTGFAVRDIYDVLNAAAPAGALCGPAAAPRIARALFEICLRRGWPSAADLCLTISKALERRLWPEQHPLWQFEGAPLRAELLRKLEDRGLHLDALADMTPADIGAALRHPAAGDQVAACVASFPHLALAAQLHPITRTVLRIQLQLSPDFSWNDRVHGAALRWLIWVEDSTSDHLYHSEMWTLTKRMWREGAQRLAFPVPITEPLPPQYYIRAISDSWLGGESLLAVSFQGLVLPERLPPHTELLDLEPLPRSALGNPRYEALYRFSHFNPIQTQAFHVLYHSDESVLLGAPTGSGKTVSAELALLRLFNAHPEAKAVYIAPLKVGS
jgi:activating signal cointegrator complex subunit 3